jgi:hypothetical protein
MLAAIKTDGQPVESEWPYIKAPIVDPTSWRPPAPAKELFLRDHSMCNVTVQHVLEQLNAGYPVLITMTLSDAFFRPDADGIVEKNEPSDLRRRHAVVAVGHGERGGIRNDPEFMGRCVGYAGIRLGCF